MKTSKENNQDNRYINLDYLRDASGDNLSFIGEMIRIFLRQTPELLSKLTTLLIEKDWDEFRKVIHKMKPTVTMMGIKEGEVLVKLIEGKVKGKTELDQVGEDLRKLEEICKASYEELQSELEKFEEE